MFVASNCVSLFLAILLSCPGSETASTAFTARPSDPSYAVEGRDFTLDWNYTLDGQVILSQFFIVSKNGKESIGKAIGAGNITFEPKYQARLRGQATGTQTELTILAVQRSDATRYQLIVTPTGTGSLQHEVAIIVQYQPNLTFISVNQTVNNTDVLRLNCTAVGFPAPNVSWSKLSPYRDVRMPFNITGKQDEGVYRCTADNGIGNPVTADVFVTVQYQPNVTFISVNQTVNDGDVVWLNCTADGFPSPTITWTRLSTNRDVHMPMAIAGKQDEGVYRCTTNNGIGKPATADVFVTVQFYRPFNTNFSTNLSSVASLNETFYLMCSAEANPVAEYRLYRENKSIANIATESQNIGLHATSVGDRIMQVVYKCVPFNSIGDGPAKTLSITLHYPVKPRGSGKNFTEGEGVAKTFTCPVDGSPEPNIEWYSVKTGRRISSRKQYRTEESGCYTCVASNSLGTPVNITQCLIVDPNLTLPPTTIVSQGSPTRAPSTTKPTRAEPGLAGLQWTIIGAVTGGVVVLVIGVGVLTWWVHKQRKCRKDSKIHNSDLERHDGEGGYSQVQGAYAQSGPPAANGTDSAAEQQIEVEAAIPTYAAVDKSKKSKKQADERPPGYAVVDKSQKKEKQEAAAIPTYAAVDKSKKKKKSREEVPAVYAEVDKSKKKKKKKIDDKNLYENLNESKKEKKPGELLYADLGDFQNPSMPTVSTSPQPLPAIKKADPYERTDYADITQFLKGNATLPPNDGNGDTEMKPKRPSKSKIQGNDKETPI